MVNWIKASLFLRDFFLRDFPLKRCENLHHFSNLCDNAQFSSIGHIESVVTLVLCWRLAENDITVVPSVTCMV